ncbi:beta-phosphoglucomutase family hydrolase [Solirubrobacter sp. CPCC 204708]|uniref:Beta-phosphoglucomutase n=1 Tax=Solirubrobacter deserti TaxID=2282478 RepID=A0ABT4RGM4_9ACTN|nr:beta-phosphoglucomutase family hydrolase [Solirubrobacter deserti]MBE2315457.1 beta-phosphoglucomutase family hydrolase [Solirubrobacter deserti]MDA0137700.1 beta-phosphoglucomutase family hydrolase [Solirubrobacter deserti]
MLGLPDRITALLFDLDGVLTDTAAVHAQAWKQTFEEEGYTFDIATDYVLYVDGKAREDGIRSFLASRDVHPPESEITRIGTVKNDLVLRLIREQGVEAYEGSRRYLEAAKAADLQLALVSSSANAEEVLKVTGMDRYMQERVDGVVKRELNLPGKPAPDTFLEAARRLRVEPAHAAVFEDALAGVQAGAAGRFGFVVGVNRANQAEALKASGADVVVDDLGELL